VTTLITDPDVLAELTVDHDEVKAHGQHLGVRLLDDHVYRMMLLGGHSLTLDALELEAQLGLHKTTA